MWEVIGVRAGRVRRRRTRQLIIVGSGRDRALVDVNVASKTGVYTIALLRLGELGVDGPRRVNRVQGGDLDKATVL